MSKHQRLIGALGLAIAACAGVGGCATDLGETALAECGASDGLDWRPGCTTRRNIAAIAADPGDLETPRPESPRDAARRDSMLSGYGRAGAASSGAEAVAASAGTGATQ